MDRQLLLQAINCHVGYPGKKNVFIAGPLSAELYAGQLICLLGPNGAGKSTFLRTVAGLQPAISGEIKISGENIKELSPASIAKKISLVLTDSVRSSNMDVYSLVALGRYPYSNWLRVLTDEDKRIIDSAVASTSIQNLLHRKVDTLSDGENQKVMLARALAQSTPIIILDEPTAHLDLPSRIQLMKLLHNLAKNENKAILISTHELDLALQVADVVWMLSAENMFKGAPEDLVLNGTFESVFYREGILFDKANGTFNIHQTPDKNINLTGEGTPAFWTKKALLRAGYTVAGSNSSDSSITISQKENKPYWLINLNGKTSAHETLGDVLDWLKQNN